MSIVTLTEAKNIYQLRGSHIAMDSISLSETNKKFDIFLSHSYADKDYAKIAAAVLENEGYDVYIDWRDDKKLSRDSISQQTAAILKNRMKQSKSLVYLITENYKKSLWMPWELGVFDGMCEGLNIAVFPLVVKNDSNSLIEYLKLYPHIDSAETNGSKKKVLWVNESEKCYCRLRDWLKGNKPYHHN